MQEKLLVYITAFIPFGKTESFVLEEGFALKNLYKNFLIIPRNPPKEIFHQKGKQLRDNAIWLPLFNLKIIFNFLMALFSPRVWAVIGAIVRHSRNFKTCLKNFVVLPKTLYVIRLLKERNVGHIHAHWGSTTATMAYIIHRLIGIPYSFTLHRWDIYENNMLREKVQMASFVRCISQKGKDDVLTIVGHDLKDKVHVVHMGVDLPSIDLPDELHKPFIMMIPANLLPVKGHRYLISACQRLKIKGFNFKCYIAGDGPLETELKKMVQDRGLTSEVLFLGRLPHEQIIEMYKDHLVDMVILPSINSDAGDMEGIPVALIEAMSYGIPVISTDTGSISELISDHCGIKVPEKNSELLAEAIEKLVRDPEYYGRISVGGRKKVENEFQRSSISAALISLIGT